MREKDPTEQSKMSDLSVVDESAAVTSTDIHSGESEGSPQQQAAEDPQPSCTQSNEPPQPCTPRQECFDGAALHITPLGVVPVEPADDSSAAPYATLPSEPPREQQWKVPMHPLLNDENSKEIIFRFHQQRSYLKRAVEQCAADRVYLPAMLIEALRCILNDETPTMSTDQLRSGSPTSQKNVLSSMELHETSELRDNVESSSYQRQKQELSLTLRERCSSYRAPSRGASSGPSADESTAVPIAEHIHTSQNAILSHPRHAASLLREQEAVEAEKRQLSAGVVPPPRVTHADIHAPKALLEEAFQARRSGNRRHEIEIIVDYIRRGREGRVLLDTATTMRLLRQVGDAHVALHEYVAAEQYYFDWYLIAEKVGEKTEGARALTLLGNTAHARGDLKAAEEWLSKAQWRVLNN